MKPADSQASSKKRSIDVRLATLLLVAALAAIGSGFVFSQIQSAHNLELLAYDWHFAALPRLRPDPRIVLVAMDDDSLAKLPLQRPSYPLPRTLHAHLVDVLREAGAKVIGFDVMFIRPIPDEDKVFAGALQRMGRVAAATEPESRIEDGVEKIHFNEPSPELRPYLMSSAILAARYGNGAKVRWFLPYPADYQTGKRYLQLPVALAASYLGDGDVAPRIGGGAFHLGHINAPIGDDGELLIHYIGPGGSFVPVPYHEVYNGTWKRTYGDQYFRDKIVLVGRISRLEDHQNTPVAPNGDMPGTEILANELQTVLQGNWIRHWSQGLNIGVKFALCLLLAVAIWKLNLQRSLGVVCALAIGWLVVSHQLFIRAGIWADTVEPIGALAATFLLAATVEAVRTRRVFHRFVPANVADSILRSGTGSSARTVEREASIVFCDVRNFTTLSETLPSEAIDQLLHDYFTAGEEAAQRLGTELDKFVGDEIMLFFEENRRDGGSAKRRRGNVRAEESHQLRAVRWALAMQESAQRITDSGLAGDIGFRVGVGVCSGVVRVGTIGASQRIQHTVIGDAVNAASRLQGTTKEVGRLIVISESTYEPIANQLEVEPLGEVSVKGKSEPIKIYFPLRVIES